MKATGKNLGVSRRVFIGSSAAAAAVGAAAPLTAQADADKFSGLKPLKPAPAVKAAPPPAPSSLAVRALNKAAFGPRPASLYNSRPSDVSVFDGLGLTAWLEDQMAMDRSDPTDLDEVIVDLEVDDRVSPLLADGLAYDTINKDPITLWQVHGRSLDYNTKIRPVVQMERLTLLRAAYSKWQLREVMNDFWMNHFNVFGREFPTYSLMPHYNSQVRRHIFGNFGDMLKANARTATMIYYLDNYANTWPNPNENYGREVLELHTLGAINNYYGAVDPGTVGNNIYGQRAGYTEIDVFECAKALIGWHVADDPTAVAPEPVDTGEFWFRAIRHYDDWHIAPITMMDVVITDLTTDGENDIIAILDYLAGHFGTAQFIAWKLCVRFISDNPPASIVNDVADAFYNNRNDPEQLKHVYRALFDSTGAEFSNTWGEKVKRPIETLVSTIRAADVDFTMRMDHGPSNGIWSDLDDTSHYPYGYGPPTGYPDERETWQGTGALVTSWRMITYLLRQNEVVNLIEMINLAEQTNLLIVTANDRTAINIVNGWVMRLLGYDLPQTTKDEMVTFMNGITGLGASDPLGNASGFDTTVITNSSKYNEIVRAVVGMIMMSPAAMLR